MYSSPFGELLLMDSSAGRHMKKNLCAFVSWSCVENPIKLKWFFFLPMGLGGLWLYLLRLKLQANWWLIRARRWRENKHQSWAANGRAETWKSISLSSPQLQRSFEWDLQPNLTVAEELKLSLRGPQSSSQSTNIQNWDSLSDAPPM